METNELEQPEEQPKKQPPMRDPQRCVEVVRNNIRVFSTSLLDWAEWAAERMNPLHKNQIEGITKAYEEKKKFNSNSYSTGYDQNIYLNRTEFKMLKTLFDKYKPELVQVVVPDAMDAFLAIYTESELFNDRIEQLLKEMVVNNSSGNFEVRSRSQEPAAK